MNLGGTAGTWTTAEPTSATRAIEVANSLVSGLGDCLIGGEWKVARQGEALSILDPSSGRVVCEVGAADSVDVNEAVSAALDAQPSWGQVGIYQRHRYLEQLASALEERLEDIALLDSVSSGNPIQAMRKDVAIGISQLRWMAAMGTSVRGYTLPPDGRSLHYTLREPFGVVGRIIPFNHPAMFLIGRTAAPLIVGNTLVIKPPEQAPLSALLVGEIIREVLPAGVVNIVPGGPAAGASLVRHPAVKRVAFTGSVETGKQIQSNAAEAGIKHVSLELGGKNPMVVLPDADLDASVDGVIGGMSLLVCQGQSCGSNSRVLVHEDLYEEFQVRLVRRLSDITIGPAYDDVTQMGPLVSEKQWNKVTRYLEIAREDGVEIVHGGGLPSALSATGGYFLEPALLLRPSPSSPVSQEEIFGPVISLYGWRNEDDALALANNVEYGLTASVWTNQLELAHAWVQALRAGYVWVNEHGRHYVGAGFGGHKNSGVGREESVEEILSYCEEKSVHLRFRSLAPVEHT